MNSNLMVGDLLVCNKGLVFYVGLVVGVGVVYIWLGKFVIVIDLVEFINGKFY